MDISDLETILKRHDVSDKRWDSIQKHPRFVELLKASIIEWQSAINTEQRVKVKAATLLEEWLSEANSRLHDNNESLAAKTELAKFLGRLAGMGLNHATMGDTGEKISININLGADTIKFSKELPAKVIDVTPTPQET
jgi:hypothetical protein